MRGNKARLVSLILALTLSILSCDRIFSSIDVVYAASSWNVVGTITEDSSFTFKMSNNKANVISFSPIEDGIYEFYTQNIEDVDIYIYRDTNNAADDMSINKVTSSSQNGYIVNKIYYNLKKGNIYYISASFKIYDGNNKNIKIFCLKSYRDIENYYISNSVGDVNDTSKSSDQLATAHYTGKPVDLSSIVLTYVDFWGQKYALKYGKDWSCAGYCDYNTFLKCMSDSRKYDGIKWNSGLPSGKGNYAIKITGKGDYRRITYLHLSVLSDKNPSSLNAIDMKSSSQKYNIPRTHIMYLKIRPSITKEYAIQSSTKYNYTCDSGLKTYGVLFDKNGNKMGTYYNSYGFDIKSGKSLSDFDPESTEYKKAVQYNKDHKYQFRITARLIAGEDYYLEVFNDTSYFMINDETGENERVYPDSTDVCISIPGYVYKAPINTSSETKITEEKSTESSKTTKKNSNVVKKGSTFTINKIKYKVTVSKKGNHQVTVVKNNNKNLKKIMVSPSVKYKGVNYKITRIGSNAYSRCKKAKSITIGKNVKIIDKNAFSGCNKVKKITVKSTVLKKVGKNAFKGISKKTKVICKKKIKKLIKF